MMQAMCVAGVKKVFAFISFYDMRSCLTAKVNFIMNGRVLYYEYILLLHCAVLAIILSF